MRRFSDSILSVSGIILFLTGLAGDCLLGILLLTRGAWQLCAWHFLCVLLWAGGVNLLTRRGGGQVSCFFISLNKWGIAAFWLGMGTFPGFGVGAYSAACLIVKYGFAPLAIRDRVSVELEAQDTSPDELVAPDRQVRPLADDLQEGDTEARRAVIARISRAATPATTQLLRQLLSDVRAEIRSDASIALSRLDDQMSRALSVSLAEWRTNPTDMKLIRALVEQYYEYASSNVLDAKCQNTYLVLARDLLLQVIAREGELDAQLWLLLARIRQRLGELPEALRDVHCALRCQPDSAGASVLALELAFRTHSWDTFLALTRRGGDISHPQQAESTAPEFVRWWTMSDLAAVGGAYHG